MTPKRPTKKKTPGTRRRRPDAAKGTSVESAQKKQPPPPRSRLTSDKRRDLIIRAARKLFSERSYEATRMEQIAEAAGCTTGPVYHFFGTKQVLFQEALNAAVKRLAASLSDARSKHPEFSPLTRLRFSCDRLLDLLNAKEAPAFALDAPHVVGVEQWRTLINDTWLPMFEGDLRAAMIEGEIQPEPPGPLATILIWAIVTATNQLAGQPSTSPEQVNQYRAAIQRIILRLKAAAPVA